jgi:flagellar hook-length control protein FliK
VALDVLPPLTDSSSTSPTKSSSKTSGNDRFLKDMAAAAAQSAKANSTSAKAASAKSKAPADPEAPPAGKSRAGSAQPVTGQPPRKSKSSSDKTVDSSDGQSASDNSTSDAAAASKGNSAASGISKGRAPGRGSAAKGAGSQNAATQAADSRAEDPSSDTSNASGLSLLQLLARSLEGDNSTAPSTDAATTNSTDATGKNTYDNGANADANAIALAQFTQALAAALGGATAALQTGTSNASVADGNKVSVTDVTKGASAQDLVALLAQNIAAESQGKSDADAPQSNVAATKDSPTNTGAAGPDSLAHSELAQMGVTSHSSLQQPQNVSNTGEIKSPVGSPAWNDELGAQVTWMTQKGLESGSLRVSPEHLGPVEVQITVQNGDASVWFGANHPDTRAALEQALPRLRELFASQGMTLTDSGVSRESPRNQTKSDSPRSVASVSAVGSADISVASAVRSSLGLVDTYA